MHFFGMIKKQFPLKSNFPFANATQKINFKLATKTCLYIHTNFEFWPTISEYMFME